MAWSWLGSLVYGAVSGFSELLPISADAHRVLMRKLTGMPDDLGAMRLAVHIGTLLAILTVCRGRIGKLLRERRIAAIHPRRRKRQPDVQCLMELQLLKVALLPLVLSCIGTVWLYPRFHQLWLVGALVIGNGILLLIPEYRIRANKDARSTSGLDALVTGLMGMLGALPGISYVGALTTAGQLRGMDRQFSLNFTYLLLLPVMLGLVLGDGWMLVTGAGVAAQWYHCLTACAAAFCSALAGMQLMRFLAVRVGFGTFAYYCWGIGMLSCILYLIG